VFKKKKKFSGFNSSCWSVGLLEGLYPVQWMCIRTFRTDVLPLASASLNKDDEVVGRKECVCYMGKLEDIWSILAMGL